MRNHFFVLTALVVALSVLAGGALAAPNNSTSTTGPTIPDPTEPTGYQGHVGNTVHIVSAEVESGTWVVVLEADVPERVTIQDPAASLSRLSDESQGNFEPGSESREVTVMPNGRTTVRLDASTYDGGRAVYVLSNGRAWYKSTGMNDNPFQYFGGVSGLMTGLGLSVVVSGGAALYVTFGKDKLVRRAD